MQFIGEDKTEPMFQIHMWGNHSCFKHLFAQMSNFEFLHLAGSYCIGTPMHVYINFSLHVCFLYYIPFLCNACCTIHRYKCLGPTYSYRIVFYDIRVSLHGYCWCQVQEKS